MPRKGQTSKLSAETRSRLMGEVNERPTITLRRLLRSQAQSRVKVSQRTIPRSPHKHWLVGEESTNRAFTETERTGSTSLNRMHVSVAFRIEENG